jgi:hypothetical protein
MGVKEFVGVLLVSSFDYRAAICPACDRSVRLDGKPIERDVRGLEGKRPVDIRFPGPIEVTRKRKDEIEGDVVDTGSTQGPNGSLDLGSIVRAVHPTQHGIIETLRTE